MFVHGLGTAHPARRYTKADCWDAFQRPPGSPSSTGARTRSRRPCCSERTASRRAGSRSSRSTTFSRSTPTRSTGASSSTRRRSRPSRGEGACARRASRRTRSTRFVVSTCTGYLCPGPLGLCRRAARPARDVQAFDLVGQGCAAALPNLQLGRRAARVAAVPQRALGLRRGQQRRDVSRRRPRRADQRLPVRRRRRRRRALGAAPQRDTRRVECGSIGSLLEPGRARGADVSSSAAACCATSLRDAVPRLAAEHAEQRARPDARRGRSASVPTSPPWICMPAGATCCSRSRTGFELADEQFALQRGDAARVRQPLERRSSTSCSRPRSRDGAPAGWWWMSSFGAGFSCHGALLTVA